MQHGQQRRVTDLGRVVDDNGLPWVGVGEHRPSHERERQPQGADSVQPPLPHEVDGEQREDKQRGVPEVEQRQLGIRVEVHTEQLRQLDRHRGGDGKAQDDECLGACSVRRVVRCVGGDDQLLPQPLGVLAREFSGERVEAAHALDRDEEGFVRRKTGVREGGQLVAEVAFELGHVGTVDGLPATQVHPPLRDLLFEGRAVQRRRHAGHAFIQMQRSVSFTACHCCCWASSWTRPSGVMR